KKGSRDLLSAPMSRRLFRLLADRELSEYAGETAHWRPPNLASAESRPYPNWRSCQILLGRARESYRQHYSSRQSRSKKLVSIDTRDYPNGLGDNSHTSFAQLSCRHHYHLPI